MSTPLRVAPTPRDVIARDGASRLLRFRGDEAGAPVLLVPSLINRWYVLDLHAGASVVEALVAAGFDVWCLDWGVFEDEDRYLGWDEVVARLRRLARVALRRRQARALALCGYCVGGTLAAIHTALHPGEVSALINLAGPIDFSHGGALRRLVDRRWFDAAAVASAGNVAPLQMQSGFVALRPTTSAAKWVRWLELGRAGRFDALERAQILEQWAGDNVPFPAAAYRRYIEALYQDNQLVRGAHRVAGRPVDLGAIVCPMLTVTTRRDVICPPAAATALHDHAASQDAERLCIPGGHVGAVVGQGAATTLYPALCDWLRTRLGRAQAA